jgi:hypothetical protein
VIGPREAQESLTNFDQARMARGIRGLTRAHHARPLYTLRAGHPRNGCKAVSGVTCPQGRCPVAVLYPLGYPTPYGPDFGPISDTF